MSAAPFIIFPAIDLRGGQVVRLKEGDPQRQTEYSSDPAAVARRWLTAGARWLHVVNLDGAFGEADSANLLALKSILEEAGRVGARVQFGGGLRTIGQVNQALDAGVSRAMVGTLAVESPGSLQELIATWGVSRLAASLDARSGIVQVRGWQTNSGVPAIELAHQLSRLGLDMLVYTDISRDGLQLGLNLEATRLLALESGLQVIASGGVSGWEDISGARQAGLAGVIVGRALYEGVFNADVLFGENVC